ncbi:MAG: hypothetical protein H6736_24225 [Alphaproteobacteria bacterium]|nr:hypothetical protein [Alphaproteobacteria bacterium]
MLLALGALLPLAVAETPADLHARGRAAADPAEAEALLEQALQLGGGCPIALDLARILGPSPRAEALVEGCRGEAAAEAHAVAAELAWAGGRPDVALAAWAAEIEVREATGQDVADLRHALAWRHLIDHGSTDLPAIDGALAALAMDVQRVDVQRALLPGEDVLLASRGTLPAFVIQLEPARARWSRLEDARPLAGLAEDPRLVRRFVHGALDVPGVRVTTLAEVVAADRSAPESPGRPWWPALVGLALLAAVAGALWRRT